MKAFATVSWSTLIHRFGIFLLGISSLFPGAANAQSAEPSANSVIVNTKFGGQIFGFDIDQNGTEGILSEAQTLSNGNVLAAVETFDQETGKIMAVLAKTETQDDFVTLGVVGTSVGLVEREHVINLLDVQRTFGVVNPLSVNQATGKWTPPLSKTHLINQVSRNQGTTSNAVFAQDNSENFIPWVFSSNVAANTFGPIVKINDSTNFGSVPLPMVASRIAKQHRSRRIPIRWGAPATWRGTCTPRSGIVMADFSRYRGHTLNLLLPPHA